MQPTDLLAYYRDHLHELASSERRDPDFCRIALQLCRDLPNEAAEGIDALELALFSVLKQANWPSRFFSRLFGPDWLSYDTAHGLGQFPDQDHVLHIAKSIALTAKHYRAQIFGSHSSARYNQRQLKIAILYACIAIKRGAPQSYFSNLPKLILTEPQA